MGFVDQEHQRETEPINQETQDIIKQQYNDFQSEFNEPQLDKEDLSLDPTPTVEEIDTTDYNGNYVDEEDEME